MAPAPAPETTDYPPGTIIGSNVPGYASPSATSTSNSVSAHVYIPVIVVVLLCFIGFIAILRLCSMRPKQQGQHRNGNGTATGYRQGGFATTGAGGVDVPPPVYAPPAAYCGDGAAASFGDGGAAAAAAGAGCSSGGASGGGGGGGC